MFANISVRYDFLNHLLSANLDEVAPQSGYRVRPGITARSQVLDIACGTGDLALTLFELLDARVIGADFCPTMLEIATVRPTGSGCDSVYRD
jgi:demethylmenaquinone methyltransferase/2-methoxy-6-polyprenyl-1,4-benzoquinol methylase